MRRMLETAMQVRVLPGEPTPLRSIMVTSLETKLHHIATLTRCAMLLKL
jgi:hypothetical protein